MSNTKAIVTLTIGARYRDRWRLACAENWSRYAERHGYDLISLAQPLDNSQRARARMAGWQKCLILDQPFASRYERIVWVDADVLINSSAPSIVEGVPVEKVGAVDEYSVPTHALHAEALAKLYHHWECSGVGFVCNPTARSFYAAYGLPARFDAVVQTGVMVLSPAHHRELLLSVYHDYEDQPGLMAGEMRALSYELLDADAVSWIDPRFNFTWSSYRALHFPFLLSHPGHPRVGASINAALRDVYFLHCTGGPTEMALARDQASEPLARDQAGPLAASSESPRTLSTKAAKVKRGWGRLSTPVVLLLFARPDTTALVLDAVRQARPRQLLVVADGPPGDADAELSSRVTQARKLIETIDWDCEVLTDLAGGHMGLTRRVESGLDWAFEIVEEAIVLEDDCVPDPTFFRFCEELLGRYRHEDRMMGISGNDFSSDPDRHADRYRVSRYPLTWGWATWGRAWRLYDPQMSQWPELRESQWLNGLLQNRHAVSYWTHIFEKTFRERHMWDYAWTLTCWLRGGLYIHPEVNLVTNIGFGPDATHTRGEASAFARLPTRPARFPLAHPGDLVLDEEGDRFLEDVMFGGNLARLFERIRGGRALVEAQR